MNWYDPKRPPTKEDDFDTIDIEMVELSPSLEAESIIEISATPYAVWTDSGSSNQERREKMGSVSGYILQLSGDVDTNLWLDCDSISGDLEKVVADLIDKETGFLINDEMGFNTRILYLDHLHIKPVFRGRDAGLITLRSVIDTLRFGVSSVLLRPFPTQFSGGEGQASELEEFLKSDRYHHERSEKRAIANLRKHYGKLGFKRIMRTEFMELDWDVYETARNKIIKE